MPTANREPVLLTWLDGFTEVVGRSIAWLVIVMMVVQFAIVVMRYAFSIHSTVMQESVMYMHAAVFMLGAAWTLRHDGHVRVDIFYRRLSDRGRAWVDLCGTLFLLFPVMLFIGIGGYGYVRSSWAILERSPDGGIPAVYLLKTLILVMVLLLLIQGVAQAIRQVLILRGKLPGNTHDHGEAL
ncbi:TRAP transporter small permease subunit [Billgrantia endophytica]|uniref:TRAP transporter small permease protein n=1 Tax=Billgrantia endophytica TaxID=2033802 RepID=A0A2N7TUV3_9GAMM|nr:TRAP transporter small permease subunit [Halomonas endophytica]PMR71971.1 C4-dicarboxylate ABC transporter permease [Halomonas endophytica]